MLFSCKKEMPTTDSDGVVIRRPHIWAKSITDDDSLMYTHFVQEITTYDNKLVIGARKDRKRILRALDLDNGNTKWDWYDIIEERTYLGLEQPVIIDNKLIWQANYWNYCIDFNNGQTVWKNSFQENYGIFPTGLGDKFIGMYNYDRNSNRQLEGGVASIISKDNGKPYFSIRPKYDTTGTQPFNISQRRGQVQFNKLFIEGTDTLLLLSFMDAPLYDYYYRECLALYNLTKKQWVYDRADMLGLRRSNIGPPPTIYQGKVYSAYAGAIVCNDLMTGKKLWQSDIESGTGFGSKSLVVAENKIFGNSANGYMYCWDLSSGGQLWRMRTSGTSSRLSYLNGILYFTGAGDGKLHAIEAATGKYLWKLDSPDIGKNKGAAFLGLCAVIPDKGGAKGKVVVLTGLNAYCYEAIN
jgi:outer membrane protein assembly factor BamB